MQILVLVQVIHDPQTEAQVIQCPVVLLALTALAALAALAARRCMLWSLLRIVDVFGSGRVDFTLWTCRHNLGSVAESEPASWEVPKVLLPAVGAPQGRGFKDTGSSLE